MKSLLLIGSVLFAFTLCAQKTKTKKAKMDFTQYPTVPVAGMESLGIQVYTADLPFNRDTLRLYLGNLDMMKSDVERLSKVDFKAMKEVSIIGGEGDLTIDMAFGKPMVVSKEQKKSSCAVPKDGCTQYYYTVKYMMPALVQARNSEGVLDSWELKSEMNLQFGNEQIEKHKKTDKGSTTSIQVVNYTSEADLALAFLDIGEASLARKAIVNHLGNMADLVYDQVFFEETTLKLDIAFGTGSAADYTETESACENAVAALESKNFQALDGPIKIWESWLQRYSPGDKKAAVNHKVAEGLHSNLSIAYTFTEDFEKAKKHLNEALKFAQTGSVNTNEVNRLKEFGLFIEQQEKVKEHNSSLSITTLVTAPDIKKTLGKRKFNKDLDFLIAKDKYQEMSEIHGVDAPKKDIGEMTIEDLLNQTSSEGADDTEISLEGRVENNMLILSGLVDANMRGKALPNSICDYPEIKTIRARNIGLTGLPDCISQLTKLEKLYINSNDFEELPDAFAAMTSLTVLDISNNNLKVLPASIFKLTGLKTIFISGNQFSDADIQKLKAALPNTKFK